MRIHPIGATSERVERAKGHHLPSPHRVTREDRSEMERRPGNSRFKVGGRGEEKNVAEEERRMDGNLGAST